MKSPLKISVRDGCIIARESCTRADGTEDAIVGIWTLEKADALCKEIRKGIRFAKAAQALQDKLGL